MILSSMKKDQQGVIIELPSDQKNARRLRALGVRKKANFSVINQQERGIVINLNNNRIALDSKVAKAIKVSSPMGN